MTVERIREGWWTAQSRPHARFGSKRKGGVRKSIALVAALAALLASATTARIDDDTPCRQAYVASGLSAQRTSFEEFRAFSGDSAFCARSAADVPR